MSLIQGCMFAFTMVYTLVVVVPSAPDCSTQCPLHVMSSQYECESRLRALGAVAADAPFGAGGNSTTLTKFSSGCLDCATRESWDIVRSCPQAMSRLQSCRGSGGSDGATLAASSCVSALGATDVGELSPSLFGLGPGQGADTRFDGGTCVAFIAEDVLARPLAGKFDSFFN